MTAITIEAINPKILLPHATRHVCIEMMQCYRRPVRQPRAADVPIQRHAKKYHASGADLNNTPPQSGSIAGRDEWHAQRECICRAQRHCCRFPGGSLAGGAFSAAPHRQSVDSKTVVLIPQGPAMCIGVDMSGPFISCIFCKNAKKLYGTKESCGGNVLRSKFMLIP